MNRMKKLISFIMSILIVLGSVFGNLGNVNAATSISSDVFLRQEQSNTCTLSSAAMMLRARAYLSGNNNWSAITESGIRSAAWLEGSGLYWSWSYSIGNCRFDVRHTSVSGMSASTLKSLLNSHPEGIELYCGGIPHAVLVTDYEGDTFYCADPASSYSKKRIPLASSYLGAKLGSQANILNNTTAYWYIASYNVPSGDTTAPTISNVKVTDVSSAGYTITCTVTDNVGVIRVAFPTWPSADDSGNPIWHEGSILGNTASCRINASEHGNKMTLYITHIYAYDGAGNSSSVAAPGVTVENEPPVIKNLKITDVDHTGYTISCEVEDNDRVVSIKAPTWPSADDSGNPIWHEGTVSGKTASCRINMSEHGNKECDYISHVYIYDACGNSASAAAPAVAMTKEHRFSDWLVVKQPTAYTEGIEMRSCSICSLEEERNIPINPILEITNIETIMDDNGFTITCDVSDETNVDSVTFQTYAKDNQTYPDGGAAAGPVYVRKSVSVKDGKFVCRVDISDHNYTIGKYITTLITNVEDEFSETYDIAEVEFVDTAHPKLSNPRVTQVTKDGFVITCDISDNVGVTGVKFIVGDNYKEYTATINGDTASCFIPFSDHNYKVNCEYSFNSYIYDAADNSYLDLTEYTLIVELDVETYSITYHLDGGINHVLNPMTYSSLNPYVDLKEPTKDGYVFEGWYTEKNGGEQVTKSTKLDGNINLYARWSPVSSGHVHDWSDSLSYDDINHWYSCSRCAETKDKARHSGNQNTDGQKAVCEACGALYDTDIKLPFEDVYEEDWYYEAVYYNFLEGLMTGKSATVFAPNAVLTRAEFASVLYSANDEPDVTFEATFPDVAESEWYADAVIWANKAGIINGYKNGSFGPYDAVAREQIAVMMYNYAIAKGYDTTPTDDLSAFNDGTEVSDYAKEAMQWAVGAGVITGKNGGTRLDAYGSTNRAECAAIIQRFMENCAK